MNPRFLFRVTGLVLALGFAMVRAQAPRTEHKTKNVLFVMTDGLRWQEVFNGADYGLIGKENGVPDVDSFKRAYWRDTAEGRREALMPFLWQTIAKQGQIYGNRTAGSDAYVTNTRNFSYPGYSETLCGFPDPRIHSNDKILNPNVTVLEWLNRKPAFHGKVAAFGAWENFPFILNQPRAGFLVNAGWEPLRPAWMTPTLELLNHLKIELPRVWEDEPWDAITFDTALEYLQKEKPRVLYISLGETDDWAHAGKYAEYMDAAHRVDSFLKTLWDTVQTIDEYRGTTALIFSPDHGRGAGPEGWKSHGEKMEESQYIWMAFLGPDTPALGERKHTEPVTQNRIAATLAMLLGENYNAAVAKAGRPIAAVVVR